MATPPVVAVVYAWLIGYRGGGGKTLCTSYQHCQNVIGAVDVKERSQHVERTRKRWYIESQIVERLGTHAFMNSDILPAVKHAMIMPGGAQMEAALAALAQCGEERGWRRGARRASFAAMGANSLNAQGALTYREWKYNMYLNQSAYDAGLRPLLFDDPQAAFVSS